MHAVPPRQKEAVLPEDVIAMLETLDRATLRRLRDRAMLLLGFAGGLRRSEIVGLDLHRDEIEDGRGCVEILDMDMVVTLRGKIGWREVEIGRGSSDSTCPIVALQLWLKLAIAVVTVAFSKLHGVYLGKRCREEVDIVSDDRLVDHRARTPRRHPARVAEATEEPSITSGEANF